MKKLLLRLFPVLLPVLILGMAFGIFRMLKATKPQQPPPRIQERVWRVAAETINPRPLSPQLSLYGTVETPDLLSLTAPANAFVQQVAVRDGERVSKGDLLIQLDPRDFLPRIAQAQAEIDELNADLDSAKNSYESDRLALLEEERLLQLSDQSVARQQRLKTQKVGADQALDEARQERARQALAVSSRRMSMADHPTRLRALGAQLASAQAKLEQIQLEYERATLAAPYDAIVADVEVTAGNQVSRGDVLLTLYATASLEIRAHIPAPYQEEILAALNGGEPLNAAAEVSGTAIPLRLTRLDGEAESSGIDGLFSVRGHGDLLRVGQMVRLRMARKAQPDAVLAPMAAIYGGDRVYELIVDETPAAETPPAETPDVDRDSGAALDTQPPPSKPVLRMRGVAVEMLGAQLGDDGRERALVRSPELTTGDRLITTHLPNAIEGLRVEVVE